MEKGNATLDTFTGFETASHNFFGENTEAEVLTDTENILADQDKSVEEKNKVVKPVEETHDFGFSSEEPEEEEKELDKKEDLSDTLGNKEITKPKGKAESVTSKSTLEFLKEKGYVDYQLPEGKTEFTEEEAEAQMEDAWEGSIDSAIDEMMEELPDAVKDILRVAKDGGDINSLIKKLAQNSSMGLNKDSDMLEESNQVLAVTEDLKALGYDEEYIEAHIDTLKATGKLEAQSNRAFKKITDGQESYTKQAAAQATKDREARKSSQREYKQSISSFLGSNKEIGGVPVNKKDQDTLPSYISDPTIQLKNGQSITEMQNDLFALMGDKESLYILSKAMKGKKGKLDFSFLVNKKVTDETRAVERNLQNVDSEKTIRSTTSGSSRSKRSLADHF
jgi:hypothetical protein